MEGVRVCSVNAKDGIVDVEYDVQRINDAAIMQATTDTGYDIKG